MRRLLYILMIIISITSISFAEEMGEENIHTETGIILKASEVKVDDTSAEKFQMVDIKITSGKYKDETFSVVHYIPENIAYSIIVEEGDKVVTVVENIDGELNVAISDFVRRDKILYMALLFIFLIVLIGRVKGIKAAITLFFTMFLILKVLLPGILSGYNPIWLTIGISTMITIITLVIIGGINSKSISAIVGTTLGVVIAGLLAYYVGATAKLTGLSSEEAMMLMYIPQEIKFNFKSLLFSGIIMGALGAVMDVAMSISSAIEEIYKANSSMTKKDLFMSGMNVGKDVMGTMSNTLILAYTGSSIPLLLLFMAYESSLVKILNLDIVATEIIRSLAGSIGLVMTIPITAFVASMLIKKENI
ncbi:YibE/F family protein [Anaeromicrobium sediminis]|uniref:YibE/F family protein n=1 Tax=Anaeromicrobium sediminis TaxID=1478221 RepID=A0A267MM45_9FIRM|nr:YibE/F family protein [Anaeromicrobium sediminis]PAB59945.1 YibE/F family protein [Anaeromicrobium sediminis]